MRDELAANDAVRIVYATPRLSLGEFHCEPGDRRWSEPNHMDDGHHVVFPGTPVRIEPDGHDAVVATSAHVMFYNRFQTYRRAVVSERGDHCAFVLVGPEVLEEIARCRVPGLADPVGRPFPLTHAPGPAGAYLAHLALLRHLRDAREPDEVFVQERLYALVGGAVAGLFAAGTTRGEPRRAVTRAAHAEAVEAAKVVMGTRLGERLTLEQVAGLVFVSPFELARMFRRRTGFSVHAFLVQLRLRAALERVLDSGAQLTDIATDLGFASPSHFSDSFHRVFGLTPSSARLLGRSRTQTRTFLEAASFVPA
ncbi:MAG TPA: helix-turn-helix transcriptional regulator [Actinomycetota bacterium]|nr:helix-turn-helix transcriptional regulator [Actinomycetota bacterium]